MAAKERSKPMDGIACKRTERGGVFSFAMRFKWDEQERILAFV
jgi:hypothetical protein